MDEYRTIDGLNTFTLTVKNSKFIALARSVTSKQEMNEFLDYAMSEYPGATHYCYAYRIGRGERAVEYSSDAGEPNNSAGPPILRAIIGSGLDNVACIVVRYFGGIKLGIGGLIRAYGKCAGQCLATASKVKRILHQTFQVRVSYDKISVMINLIKQRHGEIVNIDYHEAVDVTARMRKSDLEELMTELDGVEEINFLAIE